MRKTVPALLILALLCGGCASSERMLRLGADHTNYSQPGKERMKGFHSLKKTESLPQNREADIARGVRVDDSLVNFWPFYLANSRYTSVLWPLIDCDPYGWAFRPFYNQEGMEHSVLFPLSAWNTHNRDGWVLNTYWNKEGFGAVPLFHTPQKEGLHYYGPVWFRTGPHKYFDRKQKKMVTVPDNMWGIFPLLWMNVEFCRDTCILFPIALWDSRFDIHNGLNYIGPLYNQKRKWGVFPVFCHNYGDKDNLNSYFIPFYYWKKDLFLSLPYCACIRDHGKEGTFQREKLNCSRTIRVLKSDWRSVLLAFWGKDQVKFVKTGKTADYRYSGFFPFFHYETMEAWKQLGFGPSNWLAAYGTGPNVRFFHFGGPFGILWKEKEYLEWNDWLKKKRSSNLSVLLLWHNGTEEKTLWQKTGNFHTDYSSVVRELRSYKPEKTKKTPFLRNQLRLLQISDRLPDTRKEALEWADKLEKQYRNVEVRRTYNTLFPLWYYSQENEGKKGCFTLPFLWANWTHEPDNRECTFLSPLVFQKQCRKWPDTRRIATAGPMDRMTNRWSSQEYRNFHLLCFSQEEFKVRCWKPGVPEKTRKLKGSYWIKCGEGTLSWDEANRLEKVFYADNTEFRNYGKTSFLKGLGYLSYQDDRGEQRSHLLCGLLSKKEKVRDSEDWHILGFLYRYQKKGLRERTFVFPFILKQQDETRKSFRFGWRLLNLEYEKGKFAGGHLFFVPLKGRR